MSEDATLIVLAGGESKRMGRPKHLLPTPRGTLIDRLLGRLSPFFVETLVVGKGLRLPGRQLRIVEDLLPARSPLVGLYSGLFSSGTELCFVVACDMPFVKPALVQYILAHSAEVDVAVPYINGHHEPLCAAYRRTALPVMREMLHQGRHKITELYGHLRVRRIHEEGVRELDRELTSFLNLNTPRDLVIVFPHKS